MAEQMSDEERRLAVLSVIVERREAAEQLNAYLSQFAEYIVGRMGIPYRERGVSVLCVVLDAPPATINALTGKIGKLSGVNAKTLFCKCEEKSGVNGVLKSERVQRSEE